MSTNLSPEELQLLKQKVYYAARDGRAISVFAMLWNLDRDTVVNEVLNHRSEEDGQVTTPLIISARNGTEKVVQVLLSHFNVDIEQTGTVRFDGYSIEGATALWCAAGAGHFGIVKLLIEHGADVNHPTLTNSTPLRAACFDGRLDIVKYLVNNGADFNIANKYRNTCLMISCYKGHKEVVKFLLQKGVPPDARAHCGATALHFSAECGHVEIVQTLMEYNASMLQNDNKMTPLLVAAECGQAEVVEYLTSLPECEVRVKVDSFELLGASYANDKENYSIENAYKYLHIGMIERYKDTENPLKKELSPPVPAYDNHIECQTVEELEAIKDNHPMLHMESLTIRERILGPDNPEVPHPIIFRGAVFADGARFDRCICLWLHALRLRQVNKRSIAKDILRFAQVFSQMVHLKNIPDFESVLQVFEHGIGELQGDLERIKNDTRECEALQETLGENIHTCIYLLVIMLQVKPSGKQKEDLCRSVYKFLQLKLQLRNGYIPLHMAVDHATLVDDFHVDDVVTFPNKFLCKVLIDCGGDINAQDNRGNTPLHIIVKYTNPISDFETLHTCMISLIKNGAHLDVRNRDGRTPMDACTTGVAEVILRTNSSICLKCLASKVIKDHNIPYRNTIPAFLEDFVELH